LPLSCPYDVYALGKGKNDPLGVEPSGPGGIPSPGGSLGRRTYDPVGLRGSLCWTGRCLAEQGLRILRIPLSAYLEVKVRPLAYLSKARSTDLP